MADHLRLKRGAYWARRRVPGDLVPLLGVEITTPLHTANRREAERKARAWGKQLAAGFQAARVGLVPEGEEPRAFVRRLATQALRTLQIGLDADSPRTQDEADALEEVYADVRGELAEGVAEGDEAATVQVLEAGGVDAELLPEELRRQVAEAVLSTSTQLHFTPPTPAPTADTTAAPVGLDALQAQIADLAAQVVAQGQAKRAKTLGEGLEAYAVAQVASRTWEARGHQYERQLEGFVSYIGAGVAMDDVEPTKVIEWVDQKRKANGDPLAFRTKSQNIGTVIAFYAYAMRQQWATANPAKGLRPSRSTVAAHEEREGFTDEELRQLFDGRLIEAAKDRPERLWVPLLQLLNATRTNEACQLLLEDVLEVDGVPCIRVTGDVDQQTGAKGKRRVKTEASMRTIPIHPQLIGLGFLDYVSERRQEAGDAPKAQLFAHLLKLEGRGMANRVTTWFGGRRGYLQHIGLKRDGLTLYSLRHTSITRMDRAGVDPIARQAIEGHARQGGVGERTYIKAHSIRELIDELGKVDYAVALEQLGGLAPAGRVVADHS